MSPYLIRTTCIKRGGEDISVTDCDCGDFMAGWYHSTIRWRAMEEYKKLAEAQGVKK